jgi:hypothetical protein
MPNKRRILEIYIKAINIYETGDRKVPEAQNSVLALLTYPRPGKAEVMATTGLIPGLTDNKRLRFNPPMLLLKEFVQGPTELMITITDRDDKNQLVSFLRRLGSAFAASGSDVVEPIVPGLLRSAFRESVASGRLAIGDRNEDKIEVVAVGSLVLSDWNELKGTTTLDLTAPHELKRRGKPPIKKGSSNGQIDLVLEVRET